jgi:hypothetical protein
VPFGTAIRAALDREVQEWAQWLDLERGVL